MRELDVSLYSGILIFDDDLSIHGVWDERFANLCRKKILSIKHFSAPEAFLAFAETEEKSKCFYLVDFEILESSLDGLNLIERAGIEEHACVVTSRHEESQLIERCTKKGLKIIPKAVAAHIPIVFTDRALRQVLDAALIDDDELIRAAWENSAQNLGKKIAVFSSPGDFFRNSRTISPATPVYIDYDLGDDWNRLGRENSPPGVCKSFPIYGPRRFSSN